MEPLGYIRRWLLNHATHSRGPARRLPWFSRDRGYLDFARLYALHQASAFFVTRAKRGMDARLVYPAPTQRDVGVICVDFNGELPSIRLLIASYLYIFQAI